MFHIFEVNDTCFDRKLYENDKKLSLSLSVHYLSEFDPLSIQL